MNLQEASAKFHNKYTSHNGHSVHWVRLSFKSEKKLLPSDEKNDWLVHEKGDMLIASLNIYRFSSFWSSLFTSPSLRVNNGLTMENKSLCKCKFRFQQYSLKSLQKNKTYPFWHTTAAMKLEPCHNKKTMSIQCLKSDHLHAFQKECNLATM